jgi:hypothetical protein
MSEARKQSRRREGQILRAIDARRALRPRGRAWLNGREVGLTHQRFPQLSRSYD